MSEQVPSPREFSKRFSGEALLRLLVLLPTLLFGISRLSPLIIIGAGALVIMNLPAPQRPSRRFGWAFVIAFVLLGLTLADRIVQAPNVFPFWRDINWKSHVLQENFFLPQFETVKGESFSFVYYYGVHALVGSVGAILPAQIRGEVSLETLMGLVALLYQCLGLALLLGTNMRLRRPRTALWALVILLFLPGLELIAQWVRMALGASTYVMWPDPWLFIARGDPDAAFCVAMQPEPGWVLSWVPQHSATLFLQAFFWTRRDGGRQVRFHNRCLVLAAAISTSVFMAIGWMLLFLIESRPWIRLFRDRPRRTLFPLVMLCMVAFPAALYYLDKSHPEELHLALYIYSIPWVLQSMAMFGFVIVENAWLIVGTIAVVLIPALKTEKKSFARHRLNHDLFYIGAILLALVALAQVRMGIFNDLYMRGSTPLVVIALFQLIRRLTFPSAIKIRKLLFVVALLAGFGWGLASHFAEDQPHHMPWRSINHDEWRMADSPVLDQYKGKPADSYRFRRGRGQAIE